MPTSHPNENTTITILPSSWKSRTYDAREEDRARRLIRDEVLLKRNEPYYQVRAKIKRNASGAVERIVAYMLRANTYTADVVEITTNESYGAIKIREGLEVAESDEDSEPAGYRSADAGEYADVDMVVSTPVPDIPTAKKAVDDIAAIAGSAGLRVRTLFGAAASVAAYQSALASGVRAFFNVGHGYTGGIVLSDGNLTSAWFSSLTSRQVSPAVVYFNSCQVFNAPLQPAIMAAGARTFVGGIVNLLIGPSEKVATGFWQRVLGQGAEMGPALHASETENYPTPGSHGISGDLGRLGTILGATFFEHANFGGRSRTLGVGRYDFNAIGLPNDCISSVRIPNGLKVTLHEHVGFAGGSITLTESCSYVGSFNDKTSSITVEQANNAPAVDIYEHANFQGMRKQLGVGRYNISAMGLPNDCISSVRVGSGLKVTLYEHANFQGSAVSYVRDSSFVGTFNDKASSIVVERADSRVAEVFEHVDFQGRCSCLAVGDYNMNAIGLPNDTLSSVRVPAGLEVVLYEHANFQGATVRYRGSTSNVGSFNDKTSSIRIRATS